MTIHLVSDSAELYKLCHDIIADIPEVGHSWRLTPVSPEDAWREADLHIWDFHPELSLPEGVNWNPLRHIFLVDGKDMAVFRQRTGTGEGNIVLKPVSAAVLATFLVPAISTLSAKSLRADRDEILQWLIETNLKLQD